MYSYIFLLFSVLMVGGTAQDVTIHNLSENPGLLPFEMGEAKLFNYYRTDISRKNLTIYHDLLEHFEKNLNQFKQSLGDQFSGEMQSVSEVLKNAQAKLQSLSTNKLSRRKRFFNSYRTHNHHITNNYLNSVKYDNAIGDLENKQKKMVETLNEHISMSNVMNEKFSNKLNILSNQINKLNIFIYGTNRFYQVVNFYMIISGLRENLQDIEHSFIVAQQGRINSQILNPEKLKKWIEYMIPNQDELLFPATTENIINRFYDIIETAVMIKDNIITYSFSVPVMKPEAYKLYHLYSVPIRSNDHYKTIVPRKKYLLTNPPSNTIVTDTPCENFGSISYCKEHNGFLKKDEMECLSMVTGSSDNFNTCRYTNIDLEDLYIEQVDETFYIFVSAQLVNVKMRHANVYKFERLQGTYLLQLAEGLSFSVGGQTYLNDVRGQSIPLIPMLALREANITMEMPLDDDPLPINSLSLSDLQQLKHTARMVKIAKHGNSDVVFVSLFAVLALIQLAVIGTIVFMYRRFKAPAENLSGRNSFASYKKERAEDNIYINV